MRHLVKTGVVTEDWRVVGRSEDYYQGLKANRLLQQREAVQSKLDAKERRRIARLNEQLSLPAVVSKREQRALERRQVAEERKQQLERAVQDAEALHEFFDAQVRVLL